MDFRTLAFDACRCYVLDAEASGEVDSNILRKVSGWIRSRDIGRLAACSDSFPLAYHQRENLRFVRQVSAFFKKNAAFEFDQAEESARSNFELGERLCRISNRRLDHYGISEERISPDIRQVVRSARSEIHKLLGPIEDMLGILPELFRVTSGATATSSRRNSLPHLKMRLRNIPCTSGAIPYLTALIRNFGYDKFSFKVVDSNRVVTVPKNWKTRRTIACEPMGNLPLQLAVDCYIKRLLRRWSIDLSDQSRNQELAREGSISDSVATIDLSMASDTLCSNCVVLLLPYDWYEFLMAIRSPKGNFEGKSFEYAKLSSMGNGATFVLETLIFAAVVRATRSAVSAVYGDDIVCDSDKADLVVKTLRFLGFKPNVSKSYTSGPFRESCGRDWYKGFDITPYYFRATNPKRLELNLLCNGLMSISRVNGHVVGLVRKLIEDENLNFVPYNEDPLSGIWLTPVAAKGQGLIRYNKRTHSSEVRLIRQYAPEKVGCDIRHLSHWYMRSLTRSDRTPAVVNMVNGHVVDTIKFKKLMLRESDSAIVVTRDRKSVV